MIVVREPQNVVSVERVVNQVVANPAPAVELTIATPGPPGPPGPQGPAGAAGGSVFTHNQSTPAATWTLQHNLGRFSHVTLLDDDGTEFEADVTQASVNTIVIQFPSPHTGTAIVS